MELVKRKKNRLTEYDYSRANAYFITICTENRKNLFWNNVEASVARPEDIQLSGFGIITEAAIKEIPTRYPALSVDCYIIMPNHIHLLIQINTDDCGRPMVAPTISTVVQQMKGAVSKKFGFPIWQKGFYDHVIRGEDDYREVWNYIEGNPIKWMEDTLYTR